MEQMGDPGFRQIWDTDKILERIADALEFLVLQKEYEVWHGKKEWREKAGEIANRLGVLRQRMLERP